MKKRLRLSKKAKAAAKKKKGAICYSTAKGEPQAVSLQTGRAQS